MPRLHWTTAGESHGRALVGVLEGMPSGLLLDMERVDAELARRQGGYGRSKRQRFERDRVEMLAGTRGDITLGSPISFRIGNEDSSIERLGVPTTPRPGHADLAGCQKHGVRDPRLVLERASARETAARVGLAAIARHVLSEFDIEVFSHVVSLGGVDVREDAFELAGERRHEMRAQSSFYTLDPGVEDHLRRRVDTAAEELDSLGGVFEVRALGLPPGLGGYARPDDRLTSRLGGALLSIPAMKGVEFGLGFESARLPGSEVHDAIRRADDDGAQTFGRFARATNRAGGLEGGMTTGEPLVVRVAMKPIPTLRRGVGTVDMESGDEVAAQYQRSDVTAVPAASVVGEAMVTLILADAFLTKFGGDHIDDVRASFNAWRARVSEL